MSLSRITKQKAQALVEQKAKSAKLILRLASEPTRWINQRVLTVNIFQTVQATLTGIVAGRLFGAAGVLIGVTLNVIIFFVLAEAVPDWFTQSDDVPFMMQVYPIREEKRALIPAVCHVDGSGRLQSVRAETNPRYHRLISAFAARTGVPMLLNTSFNENEPVVCRPGEALACFLRTRMDVLVLGDWLIERA